MDRTGANEVFKALRTLWPMRFPARMEKANAKSIVDFIEENFVEFAGDTVIKACQQLAMEQDSVPSWAAIKEAAVKVKAQRRAELPKRAQALSADPQGWLYVIYEDGSCDWIYNGDKHRWKSDRAKERVETILNSPAWEPWVRRYLPKWASDKYTSRYQAEIEKQLRMAGQGPEIEDEIGVENW